MEFKKRNLGLVILLYLATGGLYGFYWIAKSGYAMNSADVRPRSAVLTSIMLGIFVVFAFTVGYAIRSVVTTSQHALQFEQIFAFAAFNVVLLYLLAAILSARIATRIRARSSRRDGVCSPVTAVVLTIVGFMSAIYLQYHINKPASDHP